MKERLTERQNEVLEFIRGYLRERSKPPTLKEIGKALGIRSTNGVYKLLEALEKKNYIRREKHAARGLELVENEGDPFALDTGGAPRLMLVSGGSSDAPETLHRRPAGFLTTDARLLREARDPGACLIVRAGDDGMNGDGIRKGDLLIAEERPWKEFKNRLAGRRLAAVLVGERLLARRLKLANGRLHLHPAAPHYAEETFRPGDAGCHVIGPLLALLRDL